METILEEINIVQNQIRVCNNINNEKIYKLKQDFKRKVYEASDKKHYECLCGAVLMYKNKKKHFETKLHETRMGQ
tara:strand:+ start:3112 stop:3336 length:225 start_codon:yes stop_codon:yes gene_type:complete